MPSHPDRVRRNYPPNWWTNEPGLIVPLSHITETRPSLGPLVAVVLIGLTAIFTYLGLR